MADDASVPLQHSQYIQIDCDFTLLQIGTRASGFADCPAALRLGEDARLAFPELIGLENSLAAIGTVEYATLTLEGIARFSDGENPFYLDIWIERCCHDRDRYWVGFEDSTQRTLVKQAILHHANATEILIAQLSASQKYIDAIIHSMADALIVTTPEGKIKTLNPAALRLFKHSADDALGQPLAKFLTLDRYALKASKGPTEIIYHAENGESHYIAFTVAQLQSEFEAWQGVIYLGRDITLRQKAEIALQQANAELQQRNQDLHRLNQLSQKLNGCTTRAQAERAIAASLPGFFPTGSGGLGLKTDSGQFEAIAVWGRANADAVLAALRSTRVPRSLPPQSALLKGSEGACGYHFTMPLLAQDEVIGNLVLWSDTASPLAETQHQLAIALSEHIALALANIRLRETLQTQSIRDALTNLYNRRYLAQTLPEALSLANAHNTPLSLVMVDIDWFKQINDTFGHQVGDRVLETVARFLQNSIREHDLAYRYGGEEFLLVLKNIEAGVARARVKQLCQNLRQLTIACAERSLSVTASFGIATFPESGRTATELLEAADAALYQAKAQGRDRVIFASPHPSD